MSIVRVRVTIDDELLNEARRLTGLVTTTELIHVALKALAAREAARSLALLGGTEPDFEIPLRRRPEKD
jgi:Arc/MetJ family transcription regulator